MNKIRKGLFGVTMLATVALATVAGLRTSAITHATTALLTWDNPLPTGLLTWDKPSP